MSLGLISLISKVPWQVYAVGILLITLYSGYSLIKYQSDKIDKLNKQVDKLTNNQEVLSKLTRKFNENNTTLTNDSVRLQESVDTFIKESKDKPKELADKLELEYTLFHYTKACYSGDTDACNIINK